MKRVVSWARQRFDAAPPRVRRPMLFVWTVGLSLFKHNIPDFASALAYTGFFALVPVLALIGFVIGALARRSAAESFVRPFMEGIPEALRPLIEAGLDQLAGSSTGVAPLAVIGFLWLASSGAHRSMDLLELMLTAKARPWWRKRLIALGWVIGMLAVLGVATAVIFKVTTRIEEDSSFSESIAPAHEAEPATEATNGDAEPSSESPQVDIPSRRVLLNMGDQSRMLRRRLVWIGGSAMRWGVLALYLGLAFAAIAGFYRVGVQDDPSELPERRRFFPGAAVALAGFFAVSTGFGLYVARLGRYATYYGGLATMAVLLLWLYLTAFAFLVGAEVNAILEGRRERELEALDRGPLSRRRAKERSRV